MLTKVLYDSIKRVNLGLIKRAATEVDSKSAMIYLKNYLHQEINIYKQNIKGEIIPTTMHLEVATYCPGKCFGCYVPEEVRNEKDVMNSNIANQAISIGKAYGINIFSLTGGEPLTKETLPLILDLLEKNPDDSFFACSNGYYVASKDDGLDSLLDNKNLSVGLSLNGFEKTHNYMRGKNTFEKVMTAAERLRENRNLFGTVSAVMKSNVDEVTSSEFVDMLVEKGSFYVLFSISDDFSFVEAEELTKSFKKFENKPIFVYNNKSGYHDGQMMRNKGRDIYVDKKGNVVNGRKERLKITNKIEEFQNAYTSDLWQGRFNY